MRSSAMAPRSMEIMRGATSPCTNSNRAAEQRCPALSKADASTSRTACSGKAELSTIMAFMPPVSAMRETNAPSRAARAWLIIDAVSLEPVKATPDNAGWARRALPMRAPSPGRKCRICGGTPARCRSLTASWATSGVCSAGFATTALPDAKAAATCPVKMARGKFHGAIQAKTPRPCSVNSLLSPVGPGRRKACENSALACIA